MRTPPEGARVVAERIAAQTTRLMVGDGGGSVPVRLSIGVGTLLPPEEGETGPLGTRVFEQVANELIACADQALYGGKHSGRPGFLSPLSWSHRDHTV